jgi:hypothetical protein
MKCRLIVTIKKKLNKPNIGFLLLAGIVLLPLLFFMFCTYDNDVDSFLIWFLAFIWMFGIFLMPFSKDNENKNGIKR